MGIRITKSPAIRKGTHYLSIPGCSFIPKNPDIADIWYLVGKVTVSAGEADINFYAPVYLPHGAVITSCIVYGNATDEYWYLQEANLAGSDSNMASNTFESADTTITNPTIDNENKAYGIYTSTLDSGDEIYGAVITYTL